MDSKKDINISFNSQDAKNTLVTKVFEKDGAVLFLYKKIERIVAAVHLVTGLMNDGEGVREEIRKRGLSVLEKTLLLGAGNVVKNDAFTDLAVDLIHLTSLLNIAFVSGAISEMNFIVLKKETDQLIELINTRYAGGASNVNRDGILDREFFTLPARQFTVQNYANDEGVNDKDKISSKQISSWSDLAKFKDSEYKTSDAGKKDITGVHNGPVKDILSQRASAESNSSERRSKIIDLLKSKDRLMIKDFSAVITGVSEKTIQRELLKMVSSGVLKKEGERRWSRYSIV